MPKKLLARVLGKLPDSVQTSIRAWYWSAKSVLYQHLFNILDLGWTLETGINLRVRSQGEWWVYNDIFVNREYDLPILKTLESHRAGRPLTVLDLGANVGYFSLRIVDLARQSGAKDVILDVTMVEGSPKVFRELQRRMQSQKLPEARIRLTHGLVGLRAGSGVILESPLHVKNTIIGRTNNRGASVGFIDLGDLMKDQAEIHLLKCDIEGAELLFLENYADLLSKVRNAVIELHRDQCDAAKCVGLLEGLGFHPQVLRSGGSNSVCFFSRG
jgi:FkbM family methyltransferase